VAAIAASTPAYDWLLANKATNQTKNIATSLTLYDTGNSLLLNQQATGTNGTTTFTITTKQGTTGEAGPTIYSTALVKNVMAVTNLSAMESTDTMINLQFYYVVME